MFLLKRKLFVITVCVVLVTSIGMFSYFNNKDINAKASSSPLGIVKVVDFQEFISNTKDQDTMIFVEGIYNDGVTNITELKKNAELIVIGTAISQESPSHVAVATKLKVSKALKGKKQNEIIIYQLGKIGEIFLNLVMNIIYS